MVQRKMDQIHHQKERKNLLDRTNIIKKLKVELKNYKEEIKGSLEEKKRRQGLVHSYYVIYNTCKDCHNMHQPIEI